jgi:hypothetical protein
VGVLAIGVSAALKNCAEYLLDTGLPNAAEQIEAVEAVVGELIAELSNAHEIIKLAMNHVPAGSRTPWFLAIDGAGLCGDGVTRFQERKALLARVSGSV